MNSIMLACNSGGRFQFIPHLTSFEEGILIIDDVSLQKPMKLGTSLSF